MKKIRFLLLLLVCSLSACASENEPINLFDDERDPQYLTNPIDSSISDISRSDLWRPLSSRNKKETFSQPTALWIKLDMSDQSMEDTHIITFHCEYVLEVFHGQKRIRKLSSFDRTSGISQISNFNMSALAPENIGEPLYLKLLLDPVQKNNGNCMFTFRGNLEEMTHIFSTFDLPVLISGSICIAIGIIVLIFYFRFHAQVLIHFGFFSIFFGSAYILGSSFILSITDGLLYPFRLWELFLMVFPIFFITFFRILNPVGRLPLKYLLIGNYLMLVVFLIVSAVGLGITVRSIRPLNYMLLGVEIAIMGYAAVIQVVRSKGYDRIIHIGIGILLVLFLSDLLFLFGINKNPLLASFGVVFAICLLAINICLRYLDRLSNLEKKNLEELKLNQERLESEVKRRTLELARKAEQISKANQELGDSNTLLEATNNQLHSSHARTTQVLNRLNEIEGSKVRSLRRIFSHESMDSELKKAGLAEIASLEQDFQPLTSNYLSAKSIEDKIILHLSSDRKDLNFTKTALGGTLIKLDQTDDPDECLEKLKSQEYDLLIITPEFSHVAKICHERFHRVKIILMTTDQFVSHIDNLLAQSYISNLIFKDNKDPSFNLRNLVTTITTVINRDFFGISKYLAWGANIKEIPVTSSKTRHEIIDQMTDFLRSAGVRRSSVNKAVLICDEMLMNIIYDAPVDEQGKPKYNHLSRTEAITLSPSEQGSIKFGFDGSIIAIAGQDPFGALTRETILKYVKSCYQGKYGSINQELGKAGGGMGIFQILSSSDLVIVNVREGAKTEFVSLINVVSHSKTDRHTTSFQFFKV
ncbi:MAG: hypothetical protein HRU19_09150 [Pseudobacteriovorax sp.]|nr:hypothetical protein [Pseudobacteriovorax sp.]